MLGANADASTAATKINSPARITGRRPKESDRGPTVSKDTAQAAKVAVANCPATGTEISRSVEISTSRGGSMNTAFCVENMASESTAKNHALLMPLSPTGAACVPMLPVPLRD